MKIDGKNYSFIDEKGSVAGEAILFMRSQPLSHGGTIGHMIEPGTTEWLAWEAYFDQTDCDPFGVVIDRFPKQKAMFQIHCQQHKPYMAPAALPWIFDPEFSPANIRPKQKERMSKDMMPVEIADMMAAIKKRHRATDFIRDEAKRNWVKAMRRLAPTEFALDEWTKIMKMRPDLVDRATEAELTKYGGGWGDIRAIVDDIFQSQRRGREAA